MNRINRFLYKCKLTKCIDYMDFTFLLPSFRYFPTNVSERLSKYRGMMRYLLDMDWRSVSIGYPHIREDTRNALALIMNDRTDLERKVVKRFIHQSREEMEALFFQGKEGWPNKVLYENLESFLSVKEQGHGLIVLGAHYDSCGAGAAFFGKQGFTVNILFDEIVYDPRVPQHIQRFFKTKYGNIGKYLNGGEFIPKKNLKEIYSRLSRGEMVIALSDVMNLPQGVKVRFMNRECIAPSGALRISLKTNSYLGAFATLHEGSGVYRTICAPPTLMAGAKDPEEILRKYLTFLSDIMLQSPERWWACDKFLEFK